MCIDCFLVIWCVLGRHHRNSMQGQHTSEQKLDVQTYTSVVISHMPHAVMLNSMLLWCTC